MARKTNIFLAIGLVLVAILAGCSDKASYPPYPVSVYIEQTGDFLEGQSFSSSNFTVTVRYFDGSEKEYSNAGVELLNNATGIVKAGDKVSINVGTDINGKPVENTITLDVFKLGSITAETKEESYVYSGNTASPVALSAEDVIVTAHYEGDKTLVLKPSDYKVVVDAISGYDATAETFDATAKVTTSIIAADTAGSDCTLTIKLTQTPVTGTIETVEEIVGYTEVEGKKTSFQIPALNYESKDDLPEPDASKVYVKVTTDATEEGEYAYVLASAVEGLELSYVDPTTKIALDDKWNTYDFAGITANNITGVAIVATWNETTTEPLTVQAASTALKVEYSGDGIVDGTANKDLNVDDFRVYLIVNGQSELVEGLKATDFKFATSVSSDNAPKTTFDATNHFVTVSYMGVPYSSVAAIDVTKLDKDAIYTISGVTFVAKKDITGIVYQQKYNAGQMPVAAVKEDLATVTVTTNGSNANSLTPSKQDEWAKVSVGGYYVDDKDGKKVPLTAGYDFTNSATKVYVAVTYTPEKGEAATYYAEFAKSAPVVESITLSVAYATMYGNTTQPMLDSAINYTVTGITPNGTVDLTVLDNSNISYYVDGTETTAPTTLETTSLGAEIGAVYAKKQYSNTVVLEDQPHGYFKPADPAVTPKFELNADDQFFIGSKISQEASDYAIAKDAYVYEKGYEEETVPTAANEIPRVVKASANPFVEIEATGNTVSLVVAYLDSTGKVVEKDAEDFEFAGRSWAEETADGIDLTIDDESLKGSTEANPTTIAKSGEFTLGVEIKIAGLVTNGDNAYSVSAECQEGTATWENSKLTIGSWSRAKITVSYFDNEGTLHSTSFFVKTAE